MNKIISVVSIFFILCMSVHADDLSLTNSQAILERAYQSYLKGETETTVDGRKEQFNRSLNDYSLLEETYSHPDLHYNIGNVYFQLGEYPWAAYYYHKALKKMPRNERFKHNLAVTEKKLELTSKKREYLFEKLFFFQNYLSLAERFKILFYAILFTFTLFSLYIWYRQRLLKKCMIYSLVVTSLLAGSVVWSHYFSQMEGVLIRSTSLYRDAGKQYARVQEKPSFGGAKVEVVGLVKEGTWLKVRTSEGIFGYVPNDVIRLI